MAREDDETIDLDPNPGWETIPEGMFGRGGDGTAYLSREREGNRVRIRYYRRPEGGVGAKVWFGPGCEGPPGHAHGGSIAAVLDECLGAAAWLQGHRALAVKLNVTYRKILPLEQVYVVESQIDSVDGRKITTKGTLVSLDGKLHSEADALFIQAADKVQEA